MKIAGCSSNWPGLFHRFQSQVSRDFRHIAVSNCIFQGGVGMRHGKPGLAFYTVDEGALEDVVISNITMQDVGTPIAIIRGDRDRCATGKGPGVLRSIRISNVVAAGAKLPSVIAGLPGSPVEDIYLNNISITIAAARPGKSTLNDVPEQPKAYPQPTMFGELPAAGLFMRHVTRLQAQDVHFSMPLDETRPEIVAHDVEELRLRVEYLVKSRVARLWLNEVSNTFIDSLELVSSSAASYRITGAKSKNLYLRGAGAVDWSSQLTVGAEVPKGTILLQDAGIHHEPDA